MRERSRSERVLVDLMLREAELTATYAAEPEELYTARDSEGMHLRDGLWRHVLQFLESGTKLGRSFRQRNPNLEWELIHEMRQELVHDNPEVAPDRVRSFAVDEMPKMARILRKARFARSRED